MNYIYDILLNYGSMPYDFFEWNTSDNILHIRKIPLIRISPTSLLDIRDNEVEFDNDFLESISKKTEIFSHKNIRVLEYACLLSDGTSVIAIMLKNNTLLKSKLLIDEEEEVLSICERLKEKTISYKKIKTKKYNSYITRTQSENKLKLKKELNKIFNEKHNEVIKYMYYECFNKKEDNLHIIRREIMSLLYNDDDTTIQKLKNLLKLLEIKHKTE